ncbi:MAG: aromatic ring-hydroxylating dioxygenase subunit alpha [Parvularculaceae bacterium]|nr:aromatic ring-hydroxylating dioxygenase subunit alpha [Parvularculaceae bacterium]
MHETPLFLDGLWYFAAASREIAAGSRSRRVLFGEPIVFGRTKAGAAFALHDVCPHRGAPLSAGRLLESDAAPRLACPYHGWAFRIEDGVCADIPALSREAEFAVEKIRVRRFPLHEDRGLVWLYLGEGAPPPAPDIGLPDSARPEIVTRVSAAAPFDEAVIGLIDPAHTPFVHKQWWWREGAGLKEKVKTFEPTALGFRMPPHRPSSNSRIYRFLGGAPTTEIEFRLPSLRFERVRAGDRTILGVQAVTPTEPGRVDIVNCLFWDLPALSLFKPFLRGMASSFLGQDGAILDAQNANLSRAPHRPLYAGDPDELAKWYLRLKRAWASRAETGGFVNPIAPATLRWRT